MALILFIDTTALHITILHQLLIIGKSGFENCYGLNSDFIKILKFDLDIITNIFSPAAMLPMLILCVCHF